MILFWQLLVIGSTACSGRWRNRVALFWCAWTVVILFSPLLVVLQLFSVLVGWTLSWFVSAVVAVLLEVIPAIVRGWQEHRAAFVAVGCCILAFALVGNLDLDLMSGRGGYDPLSADAPTPQSQFSCDDGVFLEGSGCAASPTAVQTAVGTTTGAVTTVAVSDPAPATSARVTATTEIRQTVPPPSTTLPPTTTTRPTTTPVPTTSSPGPQQVRLGDLCDEALPAGFADLVVEVDSPSDLRRPADRATGFGIVYSQWTSDDFSPIYNPYGGPIGIIRVRVFVLCGMAGTEFSFNPPKLSPPNTSDITTLGAGGLVLGAPAELDLVLYITKDSGGGWVEFASPVDPAAMRQALLDDPTPKDPLTIP